MSAQVLSPGQVATRLGVDDSTVRRWVRAGACPNVFASLPGTRIGIPAWWVEQLISPEPPVVVGQGSGATGSLSVIRRNTGGPTNRSADGSNPSAA